ncbi:MAG: hypothetical protein V3R37_05780 [Rhodospirillales bacterium]
MTAALHQITMSYAVEDDRLLLRISTTEKKEYQLWLTRRFVSVLWSALMQVIEKEPGAKAALEPSAKKAVMAMQHEEAVSASDFSQNHDNETENMTSDTGPLLVIGGKVVQGDQGVTNLILQTRSGPEVKVALAKNLLHGLCRLLIETTMKADWDMNLVVGDAAGFVVPDDRTQVH